MHFIDENFWVAVSFVVFLYFAYRPIKKAVLNSLDARIDEIRGALSQAEILKAEAKSLLDEVQKEIDNFGEYRAKVLDSAKASTERLISAKTKEMELFLARRQDLAIKLLENEKTKVTADLKKEFADIVVNNVKNYLLQSNNNSVADAEIIARLTKSD